MEELYLEINNVELAFKGQNIKRLVESFSSTFSRRYIPDYNIISASKKDIESWIGALIYWKWINRGFRVEERFFGENLEPDKYVVSSSLPGAYINESPFFFTLQVFARALARRGTIAFTDTVSFLLPNGKAVLLLGYQHSGKSTITALAANHGLIPLSTENTLIRSTDLKITGGTSILVYDPQITNLYNVNLPVHEKTKHGYLVVDLNKLYPQRKQVLNKGVEIQEIYILHCSFRSTGADRKPVKGRKIKKTLWYFATSLIKGIDYYEPNPLDLPFTGATAENIYKTLQQLTEKYQNKIYEIYGRHDHVYNQILNSI